MPKSFADYVCQQCGYRSPSFLGRCPGCGEWNTLVETLALERQESSTGGELILPQKLADIKPASFARISTGFSEFDRVLGDGIVPGSVILVAGDPGIGKSTLLLQLALNLAEKDHSCVLYVSGEESPQQIKLRADRLGKMPENILILPETNVEAIAVQIEQVNPCVIIVDSIQTMTTNSLSGVAGSVGQVRESAAKLLRIAKRKQIPLFLVGHVTKEGAIAGPKVLEHLVDTVLYLEGEQTHSWRILRGVKNRFGATDEVGIFEMEGCGLKEVINPSELFLAERQDQVPGAVVVATMEGTRPVLVEIQALVTPTPFGLPRRVASGIDFNRLQLLAAVCSRRLGVGLQSSDLYVNVAGGLKITEPAADLAVVLALISAAKNKPAKSRLVAMGEVGLLGEIRPINQLEKRLKESKKLGFNKFITPGTCQTINQAMTLAF